MSKKLKVGTKATILFAGMEYEGELVEIRTRPWGAEDKIYFVFKGKDGTLYPISDPNDIKI
jgi:hypothetical protein